MSQLPPGFVLDQPGTATARPAQQPLPSPPRQVDPYRDRDQALQEEAAARAREDQEMQRQRHADQMEQARLDREAGGAAAPLRIEEGKVATLVTRIAGGARDIREVTRNSPDAEEPGVVESLRGGLAPGGAMGIPARAIAGQERRRVHDAQRDMLDALLTLSTGAAYTPEQLDAQMVGYFPQYNDTPQEAADKRNRLQRLIAAASVQAGRAWERVAPEIEPYMRELGGGQEGGPLDLSAIPQAGMAAVAGATGGEPPSGGQPPRQGVNIPRGADPANFTIVDDYRTDTDRELQATVDSMHAQGRTYEEIAAYARSRGVTIGPPSRQALEYARRHPGWSPYNVTDSGRRQRLQQQLDERGFDPNSPVSYGERVLQGAEMGFSDEIEGVGGAIGSLFTDQTMAEGYQDARDRTRMAQAQQREAQGGLGTALEIGGGLLTPTRSGAFTGGLRNTARQGALYGGLAGFGYGEGAENSLAGAAMGAGVGAVAAPATQMGLNALGRGAQAVGVRLSTRARNRLIEGTDEVAEAANRQAARGFPVELRRADVERGLQGRLGAVEQTEAGRPIVQNALREDAAALEAGVVNAGRAAEGRAANDEFALGASVRRVADRSKNDPEAPHRVLYNRVEQQAPGFAAPADATVARINQRIAELQSAAPTGNRDLIRVLEGVRDDLAQTGLSVGSIQAQRAAMRNRIGTTGLDLNSAQTEIAGLLRGAGDDLLDAMRQTNPEAAATLTRANARYAQYRRFRDEVASVFLGRSGNNSTEEAGRRLVSLVRNKGNFAVLRRFMTQATPDERVNFAASVAQDLGRGRNGRFSAQNLVTQLGNIDDRTLVAVFGREGRDALRDLATIANRKVETSSARNTSQTGGAVNQAARGLRGAMLTAFGLAEGGLVGGAAAPLAARFLGKLGEERAARMLTNPRVVKFIRNAPESSDPRVIDRYLARLPQATAISANDNEAFQAALRAAFEQSPGRAAAEDEPN